VRAAIVPTVILGANFLAGLAISWYADKIFQRNWAEAMERVENWLRSCLPAYRPTFKPGSPLFAIVLVDIGTGEIYMGPGGGWSGTAPGVKVEEIRVADHPVMPFTWIEKSPWWTMLLGFRYETKHQRFSFPLPEEPGAKRVPIDAGPRKRTPIRTSRDRTPIATGGSQPPVPIRSGGGSGTQAFNADARPAGADASRPLPLCAICASARPGCRTSSVKSRTAVWSTLAPHACPPAMTMSAAGWSRG
jgi:hypothetical protein